MAITTLQDIFNKELTGKIINLLCGGNSQPSTTGAGSTSGGTLMTLTGLQNIGTTLPSTLQDVQYPVLTSNPLRAMYAQGNNGRISAQIFGRIYKLGSVNLAATGNQFTHDTATAPFSKTQMGTSQAIVMMPFLYITTATTTTAPVFTISYKNATNGSVTGSRTFTLPAAATAQGGAYFLHLEDLLSVGGAGDCAVQDVTQVSVSVAAAAGAADIYGFEILGGWAGQGTTPVANKNFVTNGFTMPDLNPATAALGTANSKLMVMSIGSGSSSNSSFVMKAFVDD